MSSSDAVTRTTTQPATTPATSPNRLGIPKATTMASASSPEVMPIRRPITQPARRAARRSATISSAATSAASAMNAARAQASWADQRAPIEAPASNTSNSACAPSTRLPALASTIVASAGGSRSHISPAVGTSSAASASRLTTSSGSEVLPGK